jgi:hypothetical protein
MNRKAKNPLLPALLLLITGCASDQPPQPAQFWGGVGFSYEANQVSGGGTRDVPAAATHFGFEKELGGGLGIGMEVAGVAGD